MTQAPILEIRGLSKAFGPVKALSDVQFELFVSVSHETPWAASFHQP